MVFNIITILIIITLILIEMHYGIVQYVLNKLRMYNKIKRFPGPKAYPIIGNAYMFLGNIEGNFITNILYTQTFQQNFNYNLSFRYN